MDDTTPGSKRWTHFRNALQIAIDRAAHEWSFSDFAECFPLFCEEDPETARNTYNIIADYIESRAKNDFDTILQEYQVKPAVDDLFRIAKEGKARQANDQAHNAKDLWREDLLPAEAVAARTIPILEAEVERLRVAFSKQEQENIPLSEAMAREIDAKDVANEKTLALLDQLDAVVSQWEALPSEDYEAWTASMVETVAYSVKHNP